MAFKRLFANFRDPNLNEWLAELQRRIAKSLGSAVSSPIVSSIQTVGGRPAVSRVDPATGALWLICFGSGGSPNKPNRIETYDLSDPRRPQRITSWSPGWFNVYQMRFAGGVGFFATGWTNTPIVSVDISDPSAPATLQILNRNNPALDLWLDKVSNTVVYPQNGGSGMTVIDVSNPAAMSEIAAVAGTFVGVDGTLWPLVAVTEFSTGELRIYDFTVPAAPSLVGSVPVGNGNDIRMVTVVGNYAYVMTRWTNSASRPGINVVDLSSPDAPVVVGFVSLPVGLSDEIRCKPYSSAGRSYLYLAGSCSGPGRCHCVDVTDPTRPSLFRAVEIAQDIFDVTLQDEFLYLSNRAGEQELLVMQATSLLP